jgi:cell division protein FtsZ
MPEVKPEIETFAKIKVIGVGGGGGSAVNRMVSAGIRGVDFVVMNTDVQALHQSSAKTKIHIGKTITRGLGAGMDPDMGRHAAEESQNEIREALKDTDMVFITCGLGGGTGSGASPVIAGIARELGALTVGVVTRPFSFEGPQRTTISKSALDELERNVDTIITIPNDRVLQIIDKKTSLLDSFKIVDDVLRQGVQGISELITVPGLINVDFADVKTIMSNTGSALMGIGVASGENRAVDAAKAAVSSPLLELSMEGARGILFTITGGADLGMQEVSEAAKVITGSADGDVRVIFGTVIDENMGDDIRVTVIATGFDENRAQRSTISKREEAKPSFSEPSSVSPAKPSFYSPTNFIKKKVFPNREEIVEEEKEDVPMRRTPIVEEHTMNNSEINEFDTDIEEDIIPNIKVTKTFNTKQKSSVKPPINSMNNMSDEEENEEEDLEIPAFIRRKMGI